jgi:hypothetical protein
MNPHGHRPGGADPTDRERSVLYGLACEWDASLGVLDGAHRSRMRRPLFSLRDMKRTWGTWTRDRREISLSRDLVFNHSWDSVREVLLHETAHQLADELLGASRETPHGPAFHRACSLLRANPEASGTCLPLDARASLEDGPGGHRILSRVRKLMALAESPNRHEAEAAMAKAHELMEKNNLDRIRREEPRTFSSLFLGRPALRHPREDYALALLLQDFYFVMGIWVPAFVLEKGKMGRVLEISGTRRNLKVAAYVYDFVRHFVETKWTAYNRDRGLNRYRKTDFSVGILEGFRSKVEQRNRPPARGGRDGTALAKVRDVQLENYFSYRHPHVSTLYRRGSREDPGVRKDGERVGRNLVIHKGVAARGARGRLLTGRKKTAG